VVEDMAELYEPLAEQSGVQLVTELSPVAAVDRELMSRAIANLVDNALKYGGMPLPCVPTRPRAKRCWKWPTMGRAFPEDRPRVVERFVRLDNAGRAGRGWACLALSRNAGGACIAAAWTGEAHGGDLAVTLHLPGWTGQLRHHA
jgi:K+-sensing histidine kinase KdpD